MAIKTENDIAEAPFEENIARISDETIARISDLIIAEGHAIFPKAIEKVRGDSFVVKTNIHHPTDANLILDGITRMLSLVSRIAVALPVVGWRKHEYHRCRAKGAHPKYPEGGRQQMSKTRMKGSKASTRGLRNLSKRSPIDVRIP